jgi:hypothetical protein
MGKWRDEPMHTGGMMNAGQAPYQKAANDECRICGGTHTILILFFLLSRMDRKFIQSLTFNVILIILIITHISQALVTGKRSYIESCCCCCCVCVCCHCFSSGVKIKRKRERRHVNCRILIYCTRKEFVLSRVCRARNREKKFCS